MDRNEIYNKAVKIGSKDQFEYGMRTNVGNAFVYGDLKSVDTVTYPEIGGEYMRVVKVREEYTRHTRTVTKTRTRNGKTETYTETEVYYTWDEVHRETLTCNEVSFCDVIFDTGKIIMPHRQYIKTIKESSKVRYAYYGVATHHTGTIFTALRDSTISDASNFYKDMTIDEAVKSAKAMNWTIVFWIFWVILIGGCVYGFYYIDNNWLE